MARGNTEVRRIALNKRARHRYLILEAQECGLCLVGTEVKSLRAGRASIGEAYGVIKRDELWLMGATIPVYSHGNIHNHVPTRPRKLLLHAHQIQRWNKQVREKGVTIVPLEIYFLGHLVKIEMGLVRGKKIHDKRQSEKAKSARRDVDRAMSRRR